MDARAFGHTIPPVQHVLALIIPFGLAGLFLVVRGVVRRAAL